MVAMCSRLDSKAMDSRVEFEIVVTREGCRDYAFGSLVKLSFRLSPSRQSNFWRGRGGVVGQLRCRRNRRLIGQRAFPQLSLDDPLH